MKISQIVKIPSVRIILFLHQKGEARHSELSKIIISRGTLSLNLKDLEKEGIVQRRILDTKPIQSLYSLTEKGKTVAKLFNQIEKNIK